MVLRCHAARLHQRIKRHCSAAGPRRGRSRSTGPKDRGDSDRGVSRPRRHATIVPYLNNSRACGDDAITVTERRERTKYLQGLVSCASQRNWQCRCSCVLSFEVVVLMLLRMDGLLFPVAAVSLGRLMSVSVPFFSPTDVRETRAIFCFTQNH